MNTGLKNACLLLAVCALLSGCAHSSGVGGPATGTTGQDREKTGEFFRTETLTQGIGSALFPNPN